MDTETTSTVALISLILVILVIVYLILGRIIKYRWPDSKANRFFGGAWTAEEIIQYIQEELKMVYNNNPANYNNDDDNDQFTIRHVLQKARQQTHDNTVILSAITQLMHDNALTSQYKHDIINTCEAIGIIQHQSAIAERLHRAIDQPPPVSTNAAAPRVQRTDTNQAALRRSNAGPIELQLERT